MIEITFLVPTLYIIGTNTSHHFLIEKAYRGQCPPFVVLMGAIMV